MPILPTPPLNIKAFQDRSPKEPGEMMPNPESKRAALAGDPVAKVQIKQDQMPKRTERQARSLRRAFRLCNALARAIATLAFGVIR